MRNFNAIDESLESILKIFNELNFKTVSSCSGVFSDLNHEGKEIDGDGYITFKLNYRDEEKEKFLYYLFNNVGGSCTSNYLLEKRECGNELTSNLFNVVTGRFNSESFLAKEESRLNSYSRIFQNLDYSDEVMLSDEEKIKRINDMESMILEHYSDLLNKDGDYENIMNTYTSQEEKRCLSAMLSNNKEMQAFVNDEEAEYISRTGNIPNSVEIVRRGEFVTLSDDMEI